MSTPVPPATGSTATGSTTDTGTQTGSTATGSTTQTTSDKVPETRTGSGTSADKNWEAEAQNWKARARKWEDQSKEHSATLKQQQSILAKLAEKAGIELDDGKADPAKLAEKLTATEAKAKDSAVKLAVFMGASAHDADADLLLDSSSFLKQLKDLDPDADDFTTKVGEAIKTAVDKSARFKRTGADGGTAQQAKKTSPKSGAADIPGGPGAPKTYTPDEIKRMSNDEYAKYRKSLGLS